MGPGAPGRKCYGKPNGELQTIIRNCGYLWGDLPAGRHYSGRWLSARETLAAQGFPVFEWCWGYETSSFSRPRGDRLANL